jgi:glycosyltransferase involved in cell wall biosynthesis
MSMSTPLVSVIIPVYNGERYLVEAIESVLGQTYQPLDVIVVDDGSTDGSVGIAHGFGSSVRYCFQANAGLGAARNHGVRVARGSFFAFLDADDVWLEDKLARQMEAFNRDSGLDMAFGYVRQFVSPDVNQLSQTTLRLDAEVLSGYFAGTMLIKVSAFFRVGLFETKWKVGEFIDWFSRAMEHGLKSVLLPEVVMKRRIHATNMGIRYRDHQADYVRILKAALDRRRRRGAVG